MLLNNYNVEQIFKVVSLTTGGREYDSTLGGLLDIPYKSQSDPVGSADIYIKGRYHSWRRIIFCLDHVDEPSFADELIPYAEPQAGVSCFHIYQGPGLGLLLHDVECTARAHVRVVYISSY